MRRDLHTRLVQWLRILLPVLGLGLLGSVFFLADRPTGEAALPFAEEAVAERVRQRQLTAPWYAGETAAGDPLYLQAARVFSAPGSNTPISEGIEIKLGGPDTDLVNLHASRGQIDAREGIVHLDRGVVLDSPGGWRMISTDMSARLDQTRLWTDLPLNAVGPLGELKAGSMELRRESETAPLVLHFKDGVQIAYQPSISD